MKSRGCMSDAFPPSWLVPSRGAQETQLTKAKPTSESTMFVGNRGDGNLRLHRADRAGARW
jgi:hypothetical protein